LCSLEDGDLSGSDPLNGRIIQAAKSDIKDLIGNAATLRQLKPQAFVDDTFGVPTVTDILRELEKPGRDPRPAFKAAVFKEGVETLNDLAPNMILEGVMTNVAAFGDNAAALRRAGHRGRIGPCGPSK
jgi:uncharacterized protein